VTSPVEIAVLEVDDPAAVIVVAGGIVMTLLGAVALYRALAPGGGRGHWMWLPAAFFAGAVIFGIGALVYHARDTVARVPWAARGAVHEGAPVDAWIHYALGRAYARLGARTAAITQLRAAVRLAPADSRFHRALGELYRLDGDPERAQQELQAAFGKETLP
jgi:tetratricopeptide (TPR) repeat protein